MWRAFAYLALIVTTVIVSFLIHRFLHKWKVPFIWQIMWVAVAIITFAILRELWQLSPAFFTPTETIIYHSALFVFFSGLITSFLVSIAERISHRTFGWRARFYALLFCAAGIGIGALASYLAGKWDTVLEATQYLKHVVFVALCVVIVIGVLFFVIRSRQAIKNN